MEHDDQPSETGMCSGSEVPRRMASEHFRQDSYTEEHYRHYSADERLRVSPLNTSAAAVESWSFAIVLITLSVLVSIAVIFGVYASESLQLGPNSSILINPNHLLVDSIKVVEIDAAKGSMLYGFYEQPSLDVVVNWSETCNVILPGRTHKEWTYHLNEGSQINVSYSVNSSSSEPLVLVITQGKDSLTKWLEDPSDPSTIFSWNTIRGNDSIQTAVPTSSAYYIGVGNLNSKNIEVQLDIKITAFLYNTEESYYKCYPLEGPCSVKLSFLSGNAAILSTPGRKSGNGEGYWNVKLSYGTRWATYLVGVGGITVFALFVTCILYPSQSASQERRRDQPGDMGSERNPLLSREDNDLSTRASSCGPEEEKPVEDALSGVIQEPEPASDEESSNKSECVICYDARRNCFFIPCGHCVACSGCATSIAETSGVCPVCRRQIRKVEKIYTV